MLDYYRVLMADGVRTVAYRAALEAAVRADDVVLDLGCGAGVLTFFAAALGAKQVIGIEKTHAADAAELLARQLGCGDRVSIRHAHSGDVVLTEKATLLVTETLGMLGLDEGVAGSVIDARRRLLATEARIIPRRISVTFVPVETPETYERHVGWWSSEPYGLQLGGLRQFAASSVLPVRWREEEFLAAAAELLTVDLATVDDVIAAGEATFVATRAGLLHGFGGWFSTTLAPSVVLSSFPEETHWSHAFLPLTSPVAVEAGTRIALRVESLANGSVWRWRGTVSSGAVTTAFDQCTLFGMPPHRTRR